MSWLDPFGVTSGIDSFFHPGRGYKKGRHELDRYYNDAQGYLNPYNQYGQNAYGAYSGAMNRLLNPEALENEWIKNYKESESAKNAEGMAQEHGLDAASGLGLMGSNTALNAIQGGTTQIGLDDRRNYLNDLMQKYLAGAGIAGNIFNTGANAANSMSGNAMNMGGNAAQLAYGEANAPGALFGNLLGTGIGYMAGGPMGAAIGSGMMNRGRRGWNDNAWSFGGE